MLHITNLTVTLKEQPILKNLSLTIEPGAIHALMGPNGSGKSTLAATLLGYPQFEVVEGSITFNGENLRELPMEKRARLGIFLASQQPPAVPGVLVFTFLKEAHRMLTGQEISVSEFKTQVYEAFDKVGLDHSFVYRNVHEGFSGGEKKRFEIAQLLLFKPKLAILDEIDSGLDVDALRNITKVLNECKDTAFLIITHYKRILDYIKPDKVHVLYKGSIWASDDHSLAEVVDKRGYDGLV
jgi:Fe-S cluster assembly ATP-binding protein